MSQAQKCCRLFWLGLLRCSHERFGTKRLSPKAQLTMVELLVIELMRFVERVANTERSEAVDGGIQYAQSRSPRDVGFAL
eukprot:2911131-Amphidinium_carterae.1